MSTQWETLNIFVSSTFRDLELARDRLAHVFQKIEKHILERQLTIRPYDLRWRDHHSQQYLVDWCIQMVKSCQYFIGIIGNRYGWRPPKDAQGNDNINRISITEMEILQALETIPREQRFFCFTSFSINEENQEDLESLQTLKQKLEEQGEQVFHCSNMDELLKYIEEEFLKIVDEKYPPGQKTAPLTYTHEEMLQEIISEKMKGFVGREKYITQIINFLQNKDGGNYLGVKAVAGTGKSSLLAILVDQLRNQNIPTLVHFLSMGGNSRELVDIVINLTKQLHKYGIIQELKSDYVEIYQQFRSVLMEYQKPLWVIIDGLDEIDEEGRDLSWLPDHLSTNIKVVISSRPVDTWETLLHKIENINKIELETLTENEIQTIISNWCTENNVELSANDQELLIQRAAGNPLFLKVALDEISTSGTAVGQLAITIEELFRQILNRLYKKHGENLINDYLGLIAAGRAGVSEKEIGEILQIGDDVLLLVSKALSNFLVTRKGLLTFFHREFERTIKIFMGKAGMREYHKRYGSYLQKKGTKYIRVLDELPYQLQWAEEYHQLISVLTDLEFLEQKCLVGMVSDLVHDLDFAISGIAVSIPGDLRVEIAPGVGVNHNIIHLIKRILELNMQFIHSHPETLFQALWNYGYWHDCSTCENHYQVLESEELPPWKSSGDKLWPLVQYWRAHKKQQKQEANSCWINSLKPFPMRLDSPLLKMFKQHDSAVKSVVFSPDGNKIFSGSEDGIIKIWNLHSGEQMKVLDDCQDSITKLLLDKTGKKLIASSFDKTVKIWNATSGSLLIDFKEHQHPVFHVAITSDGKKIASSCYGEILVWDPHDGTVICCFTENVKNVFSLCFHPNNELLFSGEDKVIRAWSTEEKKAIKVIEIHNNRVTDLCIHHEGKLLFSASKDCTAQLYDFEKNKRISTLRHEKSVETVQFHPQQKIMLTVSDNVVYLWNDKNDKIKILHGYHEEMQHARFHPDGKKIVTAGGDGIVRVWDIQKGNHYKLKGHEGKVQEVHFAPGNSKLLSVAEDNSICIWNAYSGEVMHKFSGHHSKIYNAIFNYQGDKIVAGSDDAVVRVWSANNGKFIHSLIGHEKPVRSVAFTPDNNKIVSGSHDKTIRIWDVHSGKQLKLLHEHENIIEKICITPNGKKMASGGLDNYIVLWDLEISNSICHLSGYEGFITALEFDCDSKVLASAATDHIIRIWSIDDGKQLFSLCGHSANITKICFSTKDDIIVSSSNVESIVWNSKTGEIIEKIDGVVNPYSICKNLKVPQLITKQSYTAVQDMSTKEELITFADAIHDTSVSKNAIAIGCNNNYVYIFELFLSERWKKIHQKRQEVLREMEKEKGLIDEVTLTVISGQETGKNYIMQESKMIMGRDRSCHIPILDKNLSRNHTLIKKENNQIEITDLGSTNGTLVNGKSITSCILQTDDVIKLGQTEIVVRIKYKTPNAPQNILEKESTNKKEGIKNSSAQLFVLDGDRNDLGKVFDIEDKIVIGTEKEGTIIDSEVLPGHFTVEKRQDDFFIFPSKEAKVVCNDNVITKNQKLIHGDTISIGKTILLFCQSGKSMESMESKNTEPGIIFSEHFNEPIATKIENIFKTEFHLVSASNSISNKLTQTLYFLAFKFNSVSNNEDVFKIVIHKLKEIFHINDIAILLKHDNKLWPVVMEGKNMSPNKSLIKTAMVEKTALIAEDMDDNLFGNMATSIVNNVVSTMICVPMIYEQETHGILYINSRGYTVLVRQNDLILLMMICELMASTLVRLYQNKARENIQEQFIQNIRHLEDDIKIHQYISSDRFCANTFIIETSDGFVIVDIPYTRSQTQKMYDFLEKSQKPIIAAFILDANLDKFNSAAFLGQKGIRLVTSEQIRNAISKKLKESFSNNEVLPEAICSETLDVVIGSLSFCIHITEVSQTRIVVQQKNNLFVGDIVVNEFHSSLTLGEIDDWLNTLEYLQTLQSKKIYPRQGYIGHQKLFQEQKEYITFFANTVKKHYNREKINSKKYLAIEQEIVERYSDYEQQFFLRIGIHSLWKKLRIND